jgi:hypothetical protein
VPLTELAERTRIALYTRLAQTGTAPSTGALAVAVSATTAELAGRPHLARRCAHLREPADLLL